MKLKFLIILIFVVFRLNAQVNLPIEKSQNYKLEQKIKVLDEHYDSKLTDEVMRSANGRNIKYVLDSIKSVRDVRVDILKEEEGEGTNDYRAQISGLGNFVASQSGDQISPSANIFASLRPYKSPDFKLDFLFNIGVNADSTNIDSVKLGTIFFPDRSKIGFGFRVRYDVFPIVKEKWLKKKDNNPDAGPERYTIKDNIEPFIEYNYSKINFRKAHADSSNLQTSTFLLGLAYSHSWEKDDNIIGFIITPYFRSVKITDGTYGLYKKMFASTVKTDINPQSVSFLGINTSLQINRFLFSFIYESLQTAALSNTPLDGGVVTIKATVTGEFIKL